MGLSLSPQWPNTSTVGFHVLHMEHSHPLGRPHGGRVLGNPLGNPEEGPLHMSTGTRWPSFKSRRLMGTLLSSGDNHVIGSGRLYRSARKMNESAVKTFCSAHCSFKVRDLLQHEFFPFFFIMPVGFYFWNKLIKNHIRKCSARL